MIYAFPHSENLWRVKVLNYIKVLERILIFSLVTISVSSCGGGGGTGSTGSLAGPGTNSATLSWNPVSLNIDNTPCTDLAGYRVYYSEQPPVTKNNSQMVDVGNTASAQINNLLVGHTYYFRTSSYDTSNNESDLSTDEVSKTIN